MKKILQMILGLWLGASLVGCSSSGEITEISGKTKKYVVGQQAGLASSSQQNYKTFEGYKVSSSVGSWTSGIKQTTSRGYKVYSSVQGNIVSETAVLVTTE